MRLMLGLLVVVSVPLVAVSQDDPLVATVVFARSPDVKLMTGDGAQAWEWGVAPQRVVKVMPSGRVWVENLSPPGTGGAWTRRADVVVLADAVGHFSEYIRAHPKDPWGYESRAVARVELREHRKAADDIGEAIKLAPTVRRLVVRGNQWVFLGDDDKALADYTEALRLDPTHYYTLTQRGILHTSRKEYPRAEADFATAIGLRPDDAVAYNKRGVMWYGRGEFDKAVADFTTAVRLHPGFAEAFANRGLAYGGRNNGKAAIADYTRAIEAAPTTAVYHYFRGYTHAQLRDFDKALPDLTEAIRLDPADPRAYLSRAYLYKQQKNTEKAVADFSTLIRMNPKSYDGFVGRGAAWDDARAYDKAAADYVEAIRLNPKSPVPYNALAWLRATASDAKQRDGKQAVELATTLCDLSMGKVADHLDTLAAAQAEAGDFDKAVEMQKRALALPGTPDVTQQEYRTRLKLYEAGQPFRQRLPAKKE